MLQHTRDCKGSAGEEAVQGHKRDTGDAVLASVVEEEGNFVAVCVDAGTAHRYPDG